MKKNNIVLKKKTNIIQFLILAYGITWLVWLPAILSSYGLLPDVPWPPIFSIGICGPLIAAVICLFQEGGWPAVGSWFKKGFSHRISGFWWLIILVVPFMVSFLTFVIFQVLSGEILELKVFQHPWIVFPAILLMITIGGGQEEYGWRGYLLPKLDELFKTWQADLIMIPLHACWHIPLFYIIYANQVLYPFWVFLVFGIGFTFLINLIFRSTGGSFIAAILFHGLVNAGTEIFPPVGPFVNNSNIPFLTIGILCLLLWLLLHYITLQGNLLGETTA